MKKSVISLFLILNCVSVCYTFTKNSEESTVILDMPASTYNHWRDKGTLHCKLATNFNEKRNAFKSHAVIGSLLNPHYEDTDKKDASLLHNQKHVFVCSKHRSAVRGSRDKQDLRKAYVVIPHQVLLKAIKQRSLTVPYA